VTGPNNRAASCVEQYFNGFYPLFDRRTGSFYWDRAKQRSVIRMGLHAHKVATREIRNRRYEYELRADADFDAVLQFLSDDAYRADTWIKGGVINVYTNLFRAGYAHSVEAYSNGELVGCLVGIHLGRVFCAEASISKPTDKAAAPFCLYSLVAEYSRLGLDVIDVQVPHEPGSSCSKLGEEITTLEEYLALAVPLMAEPTRPFTLR
jgi:leucyl/phenylalanyl-tRNA---protein transferase